jgi:ABC-type multidrug transport system ATPase subunit
LIKLENLQKVIDQATVVDIPALEIASGEISALVGPTKSGKGTLLDILIGKSRPTAGLVRLNDFDLA